MVSGESFVGNEEYRSLYRSTNIVRAIKSKIINSTRHTVGVK